MPSYAYGPIYDDLRLKAKTAWSISTETGSPIDESGNANVRWEKEKLDFAALETITPVEISRAGFTTVVSLFTVRVWLYMKTAGNTDVMTLLREKLAAFAQSVEADPGLGGSASDSDVVRMGWDAAEWPVDVEGGGAVAGFVDVWVKLEETR